MARLEPDEALVHRGYHCKIEEQLARELDRLLDKVIHNIAEKDRWLLDLDLLDRAILSMREMQYTVFFKLKAVKDQDKAVSKQIGGQTK